MAAPIWRCERDHLRNGGGEFSSDVNDEDLTLLGTTPQYKPKGSRGFLVEEMHAPIRSVALKIRGENPPWDMNRI